MPTRAQAQLMQAHRDVVAVSEAEGLNEVQKARYGNLCHKVPVMIRTCGLCQTIAFMESKKSKEPSHARMLQHIAGLLDIQADRLATAVAQMPTVQYMHKTRLLLEALVYYKRFAVSILKAEADAGGEE